jgi:hypothetical protein
LGEPQCRLGDTDLAPLAVGVAQPGQELPGGPGLAETHHSQQQQCPYPGDEVVRRGEPTGQQIGGLECGQCLRVAISHQLKSPADEADRGRRSGLGSFVA